MNDSSLLLQSYESPYYVSMSLDSFSFWVLRFCAVTKIQIPILGFELNPVYFKEFLIQTYYSLTYFSEATGFSFSLKIR